MKIKLIILVFVIAILLLSVKPSTPYSGKYYAGTTDEELVLNVDNTFNIYISRYKNIIDIKGTYNILENHIKLVSNNKNDMFFIKYMSNGEITGSVIKFSELPNDASIIFTKH